MTQHVQYSDILNAAKEKHLRIVNGTTANTNIAVSGILTTHTIVSVFAVNQAQTSATPALLGISIVTSSAETSSDITNNCTISSNGNVQCSVVTTNKVLIIIYK